MARTKPGLWSRLKAAFAPTQRSAFTGAAFSRLTTDWLARQLSADAEIRYDLRRLVDRSREVVRNTPLGRQAMRLYAENVAGPNGVLLQAKLTKGGRSTGLPHDDANAALEAAWCDWGRAPLCTVHGTLAWRDVQQLIVQDWFTNGEVLIRFIRGVGPHGFAIELLDIDHLDLSYNQFDSTPSGINIVMGVEQDGYGKPLAYHLLRKHPYDTAPVTGQKRIRVPAADILHLFRPTRVGATRGYPLLAPVLMQSHMLEAYLDAELMASRVSASKMGWIITDANSDAGAPPQAGYQEQLDASPGTIERLAPGETFHGWDPQHPAAAFGLFTRAVARLIAVGVGLSYHALTGDLESVNYSSIKAGLVQERDNWRSLQAWFIDAFVARVFREWLTMATLAGTASVPGGDIDKACTAVRFHARGWPMLEPLKEIQAAVLAVEAGLETRTDVLGEQGRDFETVVHQIAEENAIAAAAGVTLGSPKTKPPTQGDDPNADQSQTQGAADTVPGGDGGSGRAHEPSGGRSADPDRDLFRDRRFAVLRG